ncbi:hypothetical protein BJV78DRAFT_218246 [Lactifluus subvellereus]|nr:hypothetical protein BJV78DRAFT_218246 [Lactifluus subvellereus]
MPRRQYRSKGPRAVSLPFPHVFKLATDGHGQTRFAEPFCTHDHHYHLLHTSSLVRRGVELETALLQGITAQYTASRGLSHRGDDATHHSWSRGLPPALRRRHWSASFYTCTRQTATTGQTWGTRMQEALTNQTLAEDQHHQSGGEVTHTQSGRWWWEIWHLGAVDDGRDRPPHYHPEPCSCSDKSDPYSPCSCATQPPIA